VNVRERKEGGRETNNEVTHRANALTFVKIVLFNINY